MTGHKHAVALHQKTEYCNCDARERQIVIAKDAFAGKAGNNLANDAHSGQDHYVNGRMRTKPKQMLEENRIAGQGRIENPNPKEPFESDEEDGGGNNWGA